MINTTSLTDIALSYLKIGLAPLPMQPQSALFKNKVPLVTWKRYQTEFPTEIEIRKWFRRWPDAGIGTVTGKLTNLLSLDFDSENALKQFEMQFGTLPITLKFTSRPGHTQYLFTYPLTDIYNIVGLLPGVDVRGQGGLIVIPPSTHWSSSSYAWEGIDPFDMGDLSDLCDLPKTILTFILNYSKPKIKKPKADNGMPGWMKEIIDGVVKGHRNDSATRLAGWYVWKFNGNKELTKLSMEAWNAKCQPPLPDQEIDKIITSILSRHKVDEKATRQYNVTIERATFHMAPDGESKFEFFIKGIPDNSLFLNAADVISNLRFRQKIAGFTGIIMDSMSNKNYIPWIKDILDKGEVKILDNEITHEGLIAETISNNTVTPAKELKNLNEALVVKDENIYIKIATLKKYINEKTEGVISRFDIHKALVGIGFVKTRIWENKKQYRVWHIEKKAFESYFDRNEIKELFE